MKRITIQVQSDHLEREAATRSPTQAIAELVWNALDADATDVRIELTYNSLDGLESIRVRDNGHGIDYSDAATCFQKLGGSWKKGRRRSKTKRRLLHGNAGKGRFKALALGDAATWTTRFKENGTVKEYQIKVERPELNTFELADPVPSDQKATGTVVEITGITKTFRSLEDTSNAVSDLVGRVALYLRQYPEVRIYFAGKSVDPVAAEECSRDYPLELALDDGRKVDANLTVIEWSIPTERALYLCDAAGFTLAEVPPGVQAPGRVFTAYLKSEFVRELDEREAFVLGALDPDLQRLIDAAKMALKDHFRQRSAELATSVVEAWKAENIYPFEGEPKNLIETTERQVFDVVALQVNEYLPDFAKTDVKSKRFSFRLLKQAIEGSPQDVQKIIQEVLDLPEDQQADLAALLEKTTLSAIIDASKEVADRLDFVKGLELLLFDPASRDQLLERSQLHRILEQHTWLFGEQFTLSNSDDGLKKVLDKHLELLGREQADDSPVVPPDGERAIIDLMLSRRIPQSRPDQREHLVIELKRPNQPINTRIKSQIENYALTVANDERFRNTDTRWVFWVVGNKVDDNVQKLAAQRNRPIGLLYDDEDSRISVWVKSWGQIIEECRGRLQFFQEHLQYSADDESALTTLRRLHEKYLPEVFRTKESE